MPRKGNSWPLKIVFLIFFVVGLVSLINGNFFNKNHAVAVGVSLTLLGISLVIAIVFYFVPVKDFVMGVLTLERTDKLAQRLDDLVQAPVTRQLLDSTANLQRLVDRIGNPAASGDNILSRLVELRDIVIELERRVIELERRLGEIDAVVFDIKQITSKREDVSALPPSPGGDA